MLQLRSLLTPAVPAPNFSEIITGISSTLGARVCGARKRKYTSDGRGIIFFRKSARPSKTGFRSSCQPQTETNIRTAARNICDIHPERQFVPDDR